MIIKQAGPLKRRQAWIGIGASNLMLDANIFFGLTPRIYQIKHVAPPNNIKTFIIQPIKHGHYAIFIHISANVN